MDLKVGIQLYSVREAMMRDPVAAIEEVAKAGYLYLEVANHNAQSDFGVGFGVSAQKLNESLAACGARVVSAHVSPFDETNAQAVIDYHKAIGNHYIGKSADFFVDRDEVLRKCEGYNQVGKLCHENGIQFLYHNHFMEFQAFDGEEVLDLIAQNTDPRYLNFEIDTFWAMRGGKDPVEVLKKLGTRVKLIHQKDFSKNSKSPVNLFDVVGPNARIDMDLFRSCFYPEDFTEIGTGTMDIQRIINTARDLGSVEYIILEQDCTQLDPMQSIKVSMEHFRKYSGILWK